MEITKEQLDKLIDERLESRGITPHKAQLSSKIREFRTEAEDWSKKATKDTAVAPYVLKDALNILIKVRLGLKNIRQLSDEDLVVAKNILQALKELVQH